MSAHLTIVLTIALAMILNAQIVVARSAYYPLEAIKDMEAERLANRMVISDRFAFNQHFVLISNFILQGYDNEYQHFMPGWSYGENELEHPPQVLGLNRIFDKLPHHDEQLHNSLDEQNDTFLEEQPEQLPVPEKQIGEKGVMYKKSGTQYRKYLSKIRKKIQN